MAQTAAQETFAERLKQAMSQRGLKQAGLIHAASELGGKLGKSQVSQYVSGKTIPRRDVVALLAQISTSTQRGLRPVPLHPPPRPATELPGGMRPPNRPFRLHPAQMRTRCKGALPCESSANLPSSKTFCTTFAVPLTTRRRPWRPAASTSSSSISATPRRSGSARPTRSSSTCASS